ncbi:MAG TPA: hypothetical protein VKQ11_15950 [Candidatus Sulfotelmatobacter sp.]|nr:hypothetical protein [Candidatus Sulfotelmatobacter sp.]
MRLIKYFASIAVVALVLSLGAFAKDKDSGNFDLTQTARVGSTTLQPGHYKVEWTGPNNALQISIMKYGKTVATAQGKLKELPTKAENDEVTLRTMKNHTERVEEIDFNNRTEALVLPTA